MKAAAPTPDWHETNQSYLMARLDVVRVALERHAGRARLLAGAKEGGLVSAREEDEATPGGVPLHMPDIVASEEPGDEPPDAAAVAAGPAPLDGLCAAFGLTPFERDVLLMCAGVELNSTFAALCAEAQGDARRAYPTFGLALAALPGAHWSALTPASPLRRWRLVELSQGDSLTQGTLRIDERVLHHLVGITYLDDRLQGLFEPFTVGCELPPTHLALAQEIMRVWSETEEGAARAVVFLGGDDEGGKRAVASSACAPLGLGLHTLRAANIPQTVIEREALARLWEREAVMQGSALLVEQDEQERASATLAFVESVQGMLLVTGSEILRPRSRALFSVDVNKPQASEQRALWRSALGPLSATPNGELGMLTSQFNLSADEIRAIGQQARTSSARVREASSSSSSSTPPAPKLWDVCRTQTRTRLSGLAHRIEPAATWRQLVLPEHQLRSLHDIATHVRRRAKVYEEWGFAARLGRGLGISALFSGASGTGKTMAAEVIAGELSLDLYRIDLSQVVSKYIGETEKNLRRVFDAAEAGGAVLLFDEADALFGKRSEVKDSHDRYANIEISYLLQRMEDYRGLAVLTTNMKSALDSAFMRRLRFIIDFPFPDAALRVEIWRHMFPPATPTYRLDLNKLARLNATGGQIRNIALHAAFLAADKGESVTMSHLLDATRHEYDKLERRLTDNEIGGWL